MVLPESRYMAVQHAPPRLRFYFRGRPGGPGGDCALRPSRSEGLHIVRSPIVGTFYEAPSPGAPPFVKVGDMLEVGQVLCIVEAMKLMNEIECDVAGELVKKLVTNGQPIEYGQELFAVRPTNKLSAHQLSSSQVNRSQTRCLSSDG